MTDGRTDGHFDWFVTLISLTEMTSNYFLFLLVCVSFTIIGQPRNSVLIRRV